MKGILAFLIIILAVGSAAAVDDNQILEFKSKIGFTNDEDKIIEHKFLENGSKILLIGEKTLQIWDVENGKLLNSAPQDIPQFAPKGFINNFVFLGLPGILNWRPYVIDPNGKWIITIEATANKKIKSAIVRDLQNVKKIAVLDLPNISTDFVSFDEQTGEIVTFGKEEKNASFANWDRNTFQLKRSITIKDYKTHLFIKNEEKMIVGSGDTKINWTAFSKDGNNLTLRDVKTGAIEKEYTAKNLIPETTFLDTTVSADEKFLLSKRNDRIFVWEIDGDGTPRFEISAKLPKQDVKLVRIIGGKYIVAAIDKNLAVFDMVGNGEPLYELASAKPNDSEYLSDATADGKYIVVSDDLKSSVLETGGNGKPLYEIARRNEKERFTTVKFMKDENFLLVGRINRSEKLPEKTEFYDIATGKKSFEISAGVSSNIAFTNDRKYLYDENLGSTFVWNFAANKSFTIPLKVHYPDTGSMNMTYNTESPYNVENTALSPNNKFILKYGKNLVSVFDIETGEAIQTLFDAENVKYDKNNRIKDSGLGDAGWSEDGEYAYAFDEEGFLGKKRTISFWNVKK